MARWIRKQNDNSAPLATQLFEDPIAPALTGEPVCLTSSTVHVVIRREVDRVVVMSEIADVFDPELGKVQAWLTPTVTACPGLYAIEWVVTAADCSTRTFPANASEPYDTLVVNHSLTSSLPIPGSGINKPTPANLFLADGETGLVTADGQIVFAGENTTIQVAEGVTRFSVSEWVTQTPWVVGTTPTVVSTGNTVDPSAAIRLVNSNGDTITFALHPDQAAWFATAPTAAAAPGGVAEEVGEGDTLPTDDSTWELFRLDGSPILPDGLYRWSTTAGAWVQE